MSDLTLALTALTGGGTGALDKIDGSGLSAGDAAVVILSTGVYYYTNIQDSRAELSPFTIRPDTNPGTNSWHLVGTTARIGSLVKLSSNQSITTSAVTQAVDWEVEEYDDALFWEGVTNPSRFTVPMGVTKVKIKFGFRYASNSTGYRNSTLFKNGASFSGKPVYILDAVATAATMGSFTSPNLEVSASDYFEALVNQTSGGALNLEVNDATWFSIEAVGFA